MPDPQATPHQDVNTFLGLLHANLQSVLGGRFVALYLGGSLALGDFNPQRSDIDFAVVTHDELPPDMVAALAQMHRATCGPPGTNGLGSSTGATFPNR